MALLRIPEDVTLARHGPLPQAWVKRMPWDIGGARPLWGRSFPAWEGTYPDYASPEYIAIFNEIPGLYRRQMSSEVTSDPMSTAS